MKVRRAAVGEYATNCYIVYSSDDKSAMLIDPAFDIDRIEHFIGERKVTDIVLTHAHLDHIYEAPVLRKKYGASVYCGADDAPLLKDRRLYAPQNFMPYCEDREYPVDRFLKDGDELCFSDYKFGILALPGHTPGGIALYGEGALFCGDVLFFRSCGRTDFPSGSVEEMMNSLKRLKNLDGNYTVYTGHGSHTNLDYERKNNPYMKEL